MKHLIKLIFGAVLGVSLATAVHAQEVVPLADGHDKFLGGIFATTQLEEFTDYFNQVTPENAGKWGAVTNANNRPTDYQDSWFEGGWHGGLDEAFTLAKDNGFPFRMHVLVWGNQQPLWMFDLPEAEQLDAIHEWFDILAARYNDWDGGFDYIEVVNEPVNDPPQAQNENDTDSGNYLDALTNAVQDGTGGEWDWAIAAFEMARTYFPDAKLMLNEYNVISVGSVRSQYLELAQLLHDRGLLDAIGVQGHAFSTTGSAANITAALDAVAAIGVPVQVTEMDVDGPTDQQQMENYARIFPALWEHEAVEGVTLWGFRPGLWRESANLVNVDGSERLAMKWLRCYLQCDSVAIIEGQTFERGDAAPGGALVGNLVAHSPSGEVTSWEIVGGDDASLFAISDSGRVTLAESAALDYAAATHHDIQVVAHDSEGSSDSVTVRINVVDEGGGSGNGGDDGDGGDENNGGVVPPTSSSSSSGSTSGLFLTLLLLTGAGLVSRRTRA